MGGMRKGGYPDIVAWIIKNVFLFLSFIQHLLSKVVIFTEQGIQREEELILESGW